MALLDKEGLTKRINMAFKASGYNQAEFARRANVSSATASRWLSGKTKAIDEKSRENIANALQVNLKWLESGEGDLRDNRGTNEAEDPEFQTIKFYPNVQASAGHGFISQNERALDIAFRSQFIHEKLQATASNLVAIKATGDSMLPDIRDGDLLIVDCSKKSVRSEKPYVAVRGEQVIVKYINTLPDGKYKLISRNELYGQEIIEASHENYFQILGEVKHIQRTI